LEGDEAEAIPVITFRYIFFWYQRQIKEKSKENITEQSSGRFNSSLGQPEYQWFLQQSV
jgi:hypothetical protein